MGTLALMTINNYVNFKCLRTYACKISIRNTCIVVGSGKLLEILLFIIVSDCSAFHLSYNMLLNQLRCEDGNPENMLRNSFFQFQADRAIPGLEVGPV